MSSPRKTDIYQQQTEPLSNTSEVNCDDLNFITRVLKPQEIALSKIGIGDILTIKVNYSSGGIELLNYYGEVCGAISSPDIDQLLDCINKGNKFQAVVINIMGLLCDVRVSKSPN